VGEIVRRKLGIPIQAPVAATVRRLVYKNGIDTLLETAKITVKENPDLVYLVIGRGPDFADVKAKVAQLGLESNFILAGFVSDDDLPSFYNAANFFVLPSKSGEGLPLVALEAMACGLPVVATAVGGIAEILVEDFGETVPPSNPDHLARAALVQAEADFVSIKEKLRRIMTERYSWDVNVAKLISIYEQIL
jgi:glycosyltransferase involved in cell wall biosynthesis